MFFFPFWGVWSCSSCTVGELAQPLPCGWVAGLLEFCRAKLSNVGPGQCLDGRPKSFLPWLQEEREPSFRTAPCRAFAHICRDVAYFSVTAFAPNSCNLLLQMLVNPAFASAFVQFEVFASTPYFCSVGWFLPQPCMQPLAHTLLKTSWEWRNCKYVCLKTSFSALKTKEYRLQLRKPHLGDFHLVCFVITAHFASSWSCIFLWGKISKDGLLPVTESIICSTQNKKTAGYVMKNQRKSLICQKIDSDVTLTSLYPNL